MITFHKCLNNYCELYTYLYTKTPCIYRVLTFELTFSIINNNIFSEYISNLGTYLCKKFKRKSGHFSGIFTDFNPFFPLNTQFVYWLSE